MSARYNRGRVVIGMLLVLPVAGGLTGCSKVKETGRTRLMLVTQSEEMALGVKAYQVVLETYPRSGDARLTGILQRVGERIAAVAERPDFQWEFNLLESDTINAFCLPGGKIAVYTGIIPIARTEAGLAVIIGHEVAHATARHGAERISQQRAIQFAGQMTSAALNRYAPAYSSWGMNAYEFGTLLGITLPYSRSHELEADEIGLLYVARAGYDPTEAVAFWERMEQESRKRRGLPEFLSTHPKDTRRIEKLRDLMPRMLAIYEQAPQRHGTGELLIQNQ